MLIALAFSRILASRYLIKLLRASRRIYFFPFRSTSIYYISRYHFVNGIIKGWE
jgi:hypothetical protein